MLNFIFDSQWMLLLTVMIILLATTEAGFRVGLKLHLLKDEARRSQIGGVQGAFLGLLGLLLGFTFAMAINRYDARGALVLKEANAIGTTWLRTGLLPEAQRAPIRNLLIDYVEVRLKYEKLSKNPAMIAEGERESARIQNALWQHAEAAATSSPSALTVSFINSLNEVIDTDAERIAEYRNRIPTGVWILLMIVAASGCFTSSYGSGAQGARSFFTSLFLPLLITVVIFLIFDLTHSREGVISVSQQPLIDLQQSIQPKP